MQPVRVAGCEFCGGALPPRAQRGRPRRFCSDRCRHAAKYERRQVISSWDAAAVELRPVDGQPVVPVQSATVEGLVAGLAGGRSGDAVSQVAAALVEARVLAASFGRLARESGLPLSLGWRCEQLSSAITRAVHEAFGEVTDG